MIRPFKNLFCQQDNEVGENEFKKITVTTYLFRTDNIEIFPVMYVSFVALNEANILQEIISILRA